MWDKNVGWRGVERENSKWDTPWVLWKDQLAWIARIELLMDIENVRHSETCLPIQFCLLWDEKVCGIFSPVPKLCFAEYTRSAEFDNCHQNLETVFIKKTKQNVSWFQRDAWKQMNNICKIRSLIFREVVELLNPFDAVGPLNLSGCYHNGLQNLSPSNCPYLHRISPLPQFIYL